MAVHWLDSGVDKYHLGDELLPEGAYGKVFMAKRKSSGRLVAIKFITDDKISSVVLQKQVTILRKIKHPNIVRILDSFLSPRGFCIVTEYAPQGNLYDLSKKDGGLSEDKIQNYAKQLVQALNFLHRKGIFHGALKPRNILIFAGDVIKICDVGLAQVIWKTNKELQTNTFRYMAPETLLSKNFLCPADLWSLGIVLYELLGGRFPDGIHIGSAGSVTLWHRTGWHGNNPLFRWSSKISPDLESLVMRLLDKNPADRSLEWPMSFVEPRELCANTAGARVCDAAGEEKTYTQMTGLTSARLEGIKPLDWYETLSSTVEGLKLISQNEKALSTVLQPLKDKLCRVEDVNISLKIISRIVDADANNSGRTLELFGTLLIDFIAYLIDLKKPDYNDSLEQCFILVKRVLANCRRYWFGDLRKSLCIGTMDIFKKVAGCTENASGKVLYYSISCITVIVSEVAQDDLKEILHYAKEKDVVNSLLSCLIVSVSRDFIPAACEVFEAIWSLLIAEGDECKKIVDAVTKAFLQSNKAIENAVYFCLCHRDSSEDVWTSVKQIILRCCLHDNSVGAVLCGLPSSLPVTEVISGGGSNTIVSMFFSKLSSYAKNQQAVSYQDVSDLCLILARVAQSLKSAGGNSAELMLTLSSETQKSRLSNLAHHLSKTQSSLTPSVLLALASIFSLESSITSSIFTIGLPLIPESAKLCENLILTKDDNGSKLSSWQACMDGTAGLLDIRLRWGGDLAIQQFCDSGLLETFIDLVGENIHSSDNQTGLSPLGVVWLLSLVSHCLGVRSSTVFPLLSTEKCLKLMSYLISDVHLEFIRRWDRPGGGRSGVRDTINAVTGLLKSPLVALTCGNGKRDRILEDIMRIYIGILLKVGIPGQVVKCLKIVELEDAAKSVVFLAKMIHHRSVIVQVLDKGLLDRGLMTSLLDTSSPRIVTLAILKIVIHLATIDKKYYKDIEGADILPSLKHFLAQGDPIMRKQVCRTITAMCWHSDYFYGLLEKHQIIPLLVECYSDQDKDTRLYAGTAIAKAAAHKDLLHKELQKCIPQLTKLLLSAEEACITKRDACRILTSLVSKSSKLCLDSIFKEAVKVLLILVLDNSRNSSNQNEEESLLDTCLQTLEYLRQHPACLQFIQSFVYYPGVQLQDLSGNMPHMEVKLDEALDILRSPTYKLLRKEDVLTLKYSLDTISSVADVGAIDSTRVYYESFLALKNFIIHHIDKFEPDYEDLLVKALLVVKKVLDKLWYTYRDQLGDSHTNYWIDIVDFFRKVAASYAGKAEFAGIEQGSSACITIIVSQVAQDAPEEILAYAKETGDINMLLSCLATFAKSFAPDKLEFFPHAYKACNTVWSLLTVSEIRYKKEKAINVFPLSSIYFQSLDQLKGEGDECQQIIDVVTKAFLSDEAVHYAFYTCLFSGLEDTQTSVIQIILRCCLCDISVGAVLCGLPSSPHVTEVVSGGGDGTIVSVIFHLLSLYQDALVSDLCLVLATVAQSLKSVGWNSAEFMLTSSPKMQKSRLFNLAGHLYRTQSSLASSVMLALASIFSLESSRTSSISKIALHLIPESATLCDNLRAVSTEYGIKRELSSWQACMDGTVGLLDARLRWGGESAIQPFCNTGVPETLIDLIGGNIGSSDNQIGLSPVGVVWIVSLLNHCLGHCGETIFPLLFTKKYVELMSGLISDVHLELIKRCGGGKNEVRDIVGAVTDLLESPLEALEGACGHGQKKDRILESIMRIYIERLLMAGIPGQVVKCLEHVKLEDAARPVAFLARMTHHRSVIVQILDNGLFHPSTMKRLLGTSSPREVTLNILKIASDIVTMNKVYYENIERADILPFLRKFLTHEVPKMRMLVCRTIHHMCLHSDYFYGLLEKHKIVPLLVACYSDQDTNIRFYAGAAIAAAALHGDLLHKEVVRSIPQLTKSLRSAEEGYITKSIACRLLRALVSKSSNLCQVIISNGAMEALIILVENCLLNPCNQPEDEEKSLLDISLETLEKLCEYSSCRKYFHSSAHYPLIQRACSEATESKVAASVSHIFNKTVK